MGHSTITQGLCSSSASRQHCSREGFMNAGMYSGVSEFQKQAFYIEQLQKRVVTMCFQECSSSDSRRQYGRWNMLQSFRN
nr:hypothetical protein [Tanacetum cinerariifolium]